jgi:hypothetical protein
MNKKHSLVYETSTIAQVNSNLYLYIKRTRSYFRKSMLDKPNLIRSRLAQSAGVPTALVMSDTDSIGNHSRSRSRSRRAHLSHVNACRTAAGSVPRPPLGPPPGTPGTASVAAWTGSQRHRLAALVADGRMGGMAADTDTPAAAAAVSAPVLAAASTLPLPVRDPALCDGQMVSTVADDLHGCFLETLGAVMAARRIAMDKIIMLLNNQAEWTQREEVGMTEMSITFLTDMTAAMAPIAEAIRRHRDRRIPWIPALP